MNLRLFKHVEDWFVTKSTTRCINSLKSLQFLGLICIYICITLCLPMFWTVVGGNFFGPLLLYVACGELLMINSGLYKVNRYLSPGVTEYSWDTSIDDGDNMMITSHWRESLRSYGEAREWSICWNIFCMWAIVFVITVDMAICVVKYKKYNRRSHSHSNHHNHHHNVDKFVKKLKMIARSWSIVGIISILLMYDRLVEDTTIGYGLYLHGLGHAALLLWGSV